MVLEDRKLTLSVIEGSGKLVEDAAGRNLARRWRKRRKGTGEFVALLASLHVRVGEDGEGSTTELRKAPNLPGKASSDGARRRPELGFQAAMEKQEMGQGGG